MAELPITRYTGGMKRIGLPAACSLFAGKGVSKLQGQRASFGNSGGSPVRLAFNNAAKGGC
jgi:hypothetical protein